MITREELRADTLQKLDNMQAMPFLTLWSRQLLAAYRKFWANGHDSELDEVLADLPSHAKLDPPIS